VSLLSPAYICHASCNCLTLLRHSMLFARALAVLKAGSSKAARIAMMAITTSNSIKVNPFFRQTFPLSGDSSIKLPY